MKRRDCHRPDRYEHGLGAGQGDRASEEAPAVGPILAEAGATTEIVGTLLAEAHRKRPDDRMIAGYTFILEGAVGTLRLQSSGRDIEPYRAIAEMRRKLDDSLQKGGVAPEGLMLMRTLLGEQSLIRGADCSTR
jgi:hypothetical protein